MNLLEPYNHTSLAPLTRKARILNQLRVKDPSLKRELELPTIFDRHPITKQAKNSVDYTNMFLAQPHRLISLEAKASYHSRIASDALRQFPQNNQKLRFTSFRKGKQALQASHKAPNKRSQQKQSPTTHKKNRVKSKFQIHSKTQQLEDSLQRISYNYEDVHSLVRNSEFDSRQFVRKQLRKFQPQNSSLTLAAYMVQDDNNRSPGKQSGTGSSPHSLSPTSSKLGRGVDFVPFKIQHKSNNKKLSRLNALQNLPRKQTIQTNTSTSNSRQESGSNSQTKAKIQSIIENYENQKKHFQVLRKQRASIQKKLLQDYASIEENYEDGVDLAFGGSSHYTVDEQTNVDDRQAFKRELQDLSIKCETISRTVRKK